MTNYVTIKKFCADTGYSPDAVRSKIARGDWKQGREYIKAPEKRILINIEGFEKWAESTPGVRESSESSIEIDFRYNGKCCRERLALKPTPSNLKKAAQHRAAIFNAIDAGTFDYAYTFPKSKNAHKFAPSQYTVKTYLTEWLENKRPVLKASTHKDYTKTLLNIIVPRFGATLLHMLTRNDIRQWIATVDCSNKRIANILSPLRAALQDAHHDDLIQSNPLFNWTYKRNEHRRRKCTLTRLHRTNSKQSWNPQPDKSGISASHFFGQVCAPAN